MPTLDTELLLFESNAFNASTAIKLSSFDLNRGKRVNIAFHLASDGERNQAIGGHWLVVNMATTITARCVH